MNTIPELLDYLRGANRETEWVEFKMNNDDPEEIGEYVSAIASRIIAETLEAKLVKPADPESTSKKHARYVPFWA